MAELPPPPVPGDCDLRGMEWLPLYGNRLFGSDFDAHASDAEFRAGMQLWWAAWNQVPASSLPDDDVALCRLAGLGRDVKSWRKVKNRALHGFGKCDDGRLYHRTLAAFAMESWERRLKDRERKAKWREQRERREGNDKTRNATGTQQNVPRTQTGHDADSGRDGTTDEMRRDATRRDLNNEEPIGSSFAQTEPSVAEPSPVDLGEDELAPPLPLDRSDEARIVVAWNAAADEVNADLDRTEWPKVQKLGAKRKTAVKRLLKAHTQVDIERALQRAMADPWARGQTKRQAEHADWHFNFDHFVKEQTVTRYLEKPDGERPRDYGHDERSTGAALAGLREELVG